ncbi:Protein NCX-1 b [Aphelenchoides avenae]|nr:Protein NCX-1 b [Aphelenchus avenae]
MKKRYKRNAKFGISMFTRVFRAVVYLAAMLYLFYGVSIVADRFMAAIEVITSQEREVVVKRPSGETTIVLVRIWNETVSNLTLMALGSSAPEILLSVIEICGNNFEAGDLGPGTIVGSAAFNLFCIVAICIVVIPNGETRRIERNDVFWVTVIWSTFAYIWLYMILCVFSPDIVEVWEGLLTFAFFFLTVISAYVANRFAPRFGRRFIRQPMTSAARGKAAPVELGKEVRLESTDGGANGYNDYLLQDGEGAAAAGSPDLDAYRQHRDRFMDIFRQLRGKYPDMTLSQIGRMTAWETLLEAPKSRAYRRIQATRLLTGGCLPTVKGDLPNAEDATPRAEEKPKKVTVSFDPCHYICMENVGTLRLTVKCDRGALEKSTIVTVKYKTYEGTAHENSDYEPVEGVLTFYMDEDKKDIPIKIIDREEYEDDETFTVKLSEAEAHIASDPTEKVACELGPANEATVIIVDDDHGGAFGFQSQVFRVPENAGHFWLRVDRHRGARGDVTVPYSVTEGRAKKDQDFRLDDGEIVFKDNQTWAEIRIDIINDEKYEKSEDFYVQLGEPVWHGEHPPGQDGADGRPVLGENARCKIVITEDDELKSFVDKVIASANAGIMVGTSSWRQQFQEALSAGGAVEDSTDGGKGEPPSLAMKALHYFSLPWKLLFACIPPTDYAHGSAYQNN